MNGLTRYGLVLVLLASAAPALAQAPAADSTAAPAPAATNTPRGRASWTSDRMPLKVGDLVTVVVDEQAEANEHVSRVSSGKRSTGATLNGNIDTGGTSAPTRYNVGLATGFGGDSRDVGDASRAGGLTAVLTVRVTGFESEGVAKIEGKKQVTVDGRNQMVTLQGLVRSADVGAGNTIQSNRIADAMITYKGKKLAPNSSLVGRLLGAVWP